MPRIAVLDQNTINKIAAGEVIERPASVVKELVENAIDAGASAITIEIKDGGCSFIRITDNGCGIEKDQIATAFLRHSTSKIKSVEDLFCISSLGFRGEALSSIAAVSFVELITKTADSLVGSRYIIEGGVEKSLEEVGTPNGTTFIIRNLFYNTPVRRKFLKSFSTEGGYISDLIERLSLSHPEVSFRFISGGQNKLYTSGNGELKDVIYGVYGREITANVLKLDYECEFFKVSGYISKPSMNRNNRSLENYYINGRYIKSAIISKAIEDAYLGFTMPKKYPFTSLHFTIDPEIIDINVHPTKMEMRFSEAEKVYKEIYNAVHNCLSHKEVVPDTKLDDIKTPSVKAYTSNQVAPMVVKEEPVRPSKPTIDTIKIEHVKPEAAKTESSKPEVVYAESIKAETVNTKIVKSEPIKYNKLPEPFEVKRQEKEQEREQINEPAPAVAPKQLSLFDDEKKFLDKDNIINHKIIGQLFDTYWLVEFDNKLYIIDQHAAHEKVLYEKYIKRAKEGSVATQQLMPAQIVTLTLSAIEVLNENMELFSEMGFEIEAFGGNEFSLRGVPLELYGLSGKEMLLEILDDLCDNQNRTGYESIKDRIATMACKAAVKGNNKLSYEEIKVLIKDLLSLENPYNCPHGRPTMITLSQYELEKKFKRIV